VICGDWKLIREHKAPWHLYNLTENRTETKDLAKSRPEIVEELTSLFEIWIESQKVMPQPMR